MANISFRKDWMKSGTITKLVHKLNEATKPNESGSISFVRRDHEELFFLLTESIVIPKGLSRRDLSAISYRTFIELRKLREVSEESLLAEMGQRVRSHLNIPSKTFTMCAKCRLQGMPLVPASHFSIEDVNIRTTAYLPKKFQVSEHLITNMGYIRQDKPPSYGYIIFTTKARTENEAMKKIYAARDLLFSVINTAWRSVGYRQDHRPVAKLWLGPYHFVFEGRKKYDKRRIWYDPDFKESDWTTFSPQAAEFHKRAPQFRKVLKTLDAHPLKECLIKSLKLISDGMCSGNLSYRIMRYWSAAEALYTKHDEKTPFSKLCDRLTFASESEAWLDKLKLQTLYSMRNNYAHHGKLEDNETNLIQHLQETVLNHIYYYIGHATDIESQEDLLLMIDMPSTEESLLRRKLAIDRKLQILKTKSHKA